MTTAVDHDHLAAANAVQVSSQGSYSLVSFGTVLWKSKSTGFFSLIPRFMSEAAKTKDRLWFLFMCLFV